jgi:hypothetical protein
MEIDGNVDIEAERFPVRLDRSDGPIDLGVWSKKSRGLPVVVLQEAAQSLLAAHFAIAATHPLFSRWKKQNISFTLMVSFSMVVLGECRYRSPQGRLAEQNQPRQAFLFYRSHPSLCECIQIRTPCRQLQWLYSPGLQHLAERFTELGVAIM